MPRPRVLIAEDEALIALELQHRLEEMGYLVSDVVTTAEAAIERALRSEPDLLVLDIRLAGALDGIDAARHIHAHRATPVLFLSAFDDDQTLSRAMEIPSSRYLLKPFDPRLLHITIDAMVYRFEAERAQEREERRRRLAEHRLATMLDRSSDAILSVDADLRIDVFNRGAEGVFECPAHLALGTSVETLFAPEERLAQRAVLEQALRSDVGNVRTVLCRRRCGVTFPAEVSVARVEVDDDVVLMLIFRDVSERVRLEQHFVQTQKLEAVGRLAAAVAHDFQTLLSTIRAHVFLASEHADRVARESLDAVVDAVDHGATLARALLASARRDRSEAVARDVSLEAREMRRLLRAVAKPPVEMRFELRCDAGVAKLADAELEQILLNLVSNARDSMPEGGALVVRTHPVVLERTTVVVTGTLPPGRYVALEVEDEGCGIDPRWMPQVFEPFFTTKPLGQGTGIGLSTTHAIVHARRGAIDLRSSPSGTRVTVLFPATDEPVVCRRARELPSPYVIVLIPDPATRDVLERLLVADRVPHRIARSAREVRELLGGAFGLVIGTEHDDDVGAWLRAEHPELPWLAIAGAFDAALDPDGVSLESAPITLHALSRLVERLREPSR